MEREKEELIPVKIEGVEIVELMVRNINGNGVLFTRDGKIIGHQVSGKGHYFYVGHEPDRQQTFRTTFLVNSMKSDVP